MLKPEGREDREDIVVVDWWVRVVFVVEIPVGRSGRVNFGTSYTVIVGYRVVLRIVDRC
jgi:hypothetical protein